MQSNKYMRSKIKTSFLQLLIFVLALCSSANSLKLFAADDEPNVLTVLMKVEVVENWKTIRYVLFRNTGEKYNHLIFKGRVLDESTFIDLKVGTSYTRSELLGKFFPKGHCATIIRKAGIPATKYLVLGYSTSVVEGNTLFTMFFRDYNDSKAPRFKKTVTLETLIQFNIAYTNVPYEPCFDSNTMPMMALLPLDPIFDKAEDPAQVEKEKEQEKAEAKKKESVKSEPTKKDPKGSDDKSQNTKKGG
jgi:hypothetical protein